MIYIEMSESIYKNNELENEMTLDMSYFWYSDVGFWSMTTWMMINKSARPVLDWSVILNCLVILKTVGIMSLDFFCPI